MEIPDEKPPGPLKAHEQDSFLPQEIIIKVEGEDAGSLATPSQEGINFKIVTVDFTHEDQETWTPDRGVTPPENHRELVSWDLATAFGRRESTQKESNFDEELSQAVKIEKLTRDDPWLSSCEEVQDCKDQLEKQGRLSQETVLTQRKAVIHERVCKSDDLGKSVVCSSLLSLPMIPIKTIFINICQMLRSCILLLL